MNEKQMIAKKNTVVPLILGILSIPTALFAIIGFILGSVGVVLSAKGFKYSNMAKVVLVLSVIGIILAISSGIIGYMEFNHAMRVVKWSNKGGLK